MAYKIGQSSSSKTKQWTTLLLSIAIIRDLGRIQTCNLLSRNQVHYSVMLRGHYIDIQ